MLPNFEFSVILVTRRVDGRWTEPGIVPFSGRYRDLEPAVSPDGNSFFFVSYRPDDGIGEPDDDADIWVADRAGDGWAEPRPLGPPINTAGQEYFPSVTRDGTLYFTRRVSDGDEAIYRAVLAGGRYEVPVRLGPEVNAGRARANAFVAPDEGFLILPVFGLEDSLGGMDYYVSFRDPDGAWTGPVHLGDAVNSESRLEYSASLSPDGRFLFFMSNRGRYADRRMDPPLDRAGLRRLHREPENLSLIHI